MKPYSQLRTCTLALLTILASRGTDSVMAQGSAFTYQGRLNDETGPANGIYDFRFALFNASTGGSQNGSAINGFGATVNHGVFSVALDFGENFNGGARWLEIAVRTNGNGSFTLLSPRQQLTAAPYAITAGNFTGLLPSTGLSGTYDGGVVFNNPANVFRGDGAELTGLNGDSLSSGTVADARLSANVPLLNANQSFSGQVGAAGGIRIPQTNIWFRSDNNHGLGWFGSGRAFAGSTAVDGPVLFGYGGGALGTEQFGAEKLVLSWNAIGRVGIGVSNPQSSLDVNGQARAQGVLSTGEAPLGSSTPSSKFAFASTYTEGTFINWNGTGNDAGCRRLLGAEDYHCGFGEAFGNGIASPVIWMYEASGNALEVRKVSFNQQVPSGQKLFAVHSDGTTEVQVLEITGGADLAEPFQMSGSDIPKGALVVIDEEHPGQLKLATEPYDHRVAGIVSGANGIHPGLTLHQQGVVEGGLNVALSGRVYALADASTGRIKPGDLLTSSATPGHVMSAKEHSQAQGAIVGKAMSSLAEGKGMVLVLVSLQ